MLRELVALFVIVVALPMSASAAPRAISETALRGFDLSEPKCVEGEREVSVEAHPGKHIAVRPDCIGPACSGKEADDEVGVVYFGERYLIPRIGRWASPDPLHVHAAGGGEPLNSYHYVSGNILQARDPLGLCGEGQDCTGQFKAKKENAAANTAAVNVGREAAREQVRREIQATNFSRLDRRDMSPSLVEGLIGSERFQARHGVRRAGRGYEAIPVDVPEDPIAQQAFFSYLEREGSQAVERHRATGDAIESFNNAVVGGGMRQPFRGRTVPQGMSRSSFRRMSEMVRDRAGHISDDIVVHGSRARGTARGDSDIDIAVRVSPERFQELMRERFGTPNPGSARERTMHRAMETGKIQAGEAGLRGLRRQLEAEFARLSMSLLSERQARSIVARSSRSNPLTRREEPRSE